MSQVHNVTHVPVHSPLPCLLSIFGAGVFSLRPTQMLVSISVRFGNRTTFSDSRSNFHTRVGYRTNVCRRRLASDLARASERIPAQGALEDHHDLPPGSPTEKVVQLNLKPSSE